MSFNIIKEALLGMACRIMIKPIFHFPVSIIQHFIFFLTACFVLFFSLMSRVTPFFSSRFFHVSYLSTGIVFILVVKGIMPNKVVRVAR